MNYQDTVNWMFQQLPMYQNKGKSAFKTDITNTLNLAAHLNHPEDDFKSIHVAGTNGKGSTSHILASVLQEAGYKVGLYTSPHLKDFRERIRINGDVISEDFVIHFVEDNLKFFETNQLSFFEMTVGMAFSYFAKQDVDIAIIEVGLGGRLDSTNIITPELSVITNIGYDHTQMLGDTLQLIAGEKAGIIKKNIPVVIGETQPETEEVFKLKAKSTKSNIYFADQLIHEILESDLKGSYQVHNKKTVLQSLIILKELGYSISDEAIQKGFLNVSGNTGLQGRWQQIGDKPKVVCDTAHNKEGLTYVMDQLQKETFDLLHIVFGVVNDKDLERIIPLLPADATYYFCKPNVQRGLDAEILKKTFKKSGLIGKAYNSVGSALSAAKSNAKVTDLIYVGGSTFVVAEII
ncbi:bifunctional folylpolyglutamate synthase/dihydrofolate synthase [Winogradskyella wichelsiae]|uniref:bifunctional folylpolyglutamate synthase/dihydrofolate synthase n=1 Tax=Winogradskyella wichelsiae TaxID=2697007 RepID=UPI0015C949F4|nr:folylpolyglutamate synthase/dihydrofolate synthase family protein [Winogradskyella wichelsiae]